MKNFAGVRIARFFWALITFVILQGVCFAQNGGGSSAPAQPATTGSQPAATPVPAEVLKELEAMKARIAELEAQLKAMKSTEPVKVTVADGSASLAAPNSSEAAPTEAPSSTAAPAIAKNISAAKKSETKAATAEPFAFADFTWLNGNSRTHESPLDTKYFTPEFRADTSYIYDFAHPSDHTLVGSSESGRTGEVQLQQLGIGGDFHVGNVRGRFMTQYGMYSTMTPRNDGSPTVGQLQLADAYRYISEAYGGYHFNVLHGVNVDAGIFMSYIGLFSYYNFDNWAYQPSYVSSNTPWFFQGVRAQIFVTDKLKLEPWFVN